MESLKTWRLAACKQLLSTGVFDGPVDSSSKRGVQGGDSEPVNDNGTLYGIN